MVKGGGEYYVRNFDFALDEFLQDAETVEAGHLDVEEDEVGVVFFDEVDGFEAVFALADEGDFGESFEEEGEFFARGLFVVDDDGVDGHGLKGKYSAETGRLDNSDQIAAIRKRSVAVFWKDMVCDRISVTPTALEIFSDWVPSAYALS